MDSIAGLRRGTTGHIYRHVEWGSNPSLYGRNSQLASWFCKRLYYQQRITKLKYTWDWVQFLKYQGFDALAGFKAAFACKILLIGGVVRKLRCWRLHVKGM
jgi:hypothetical protein